MAKLLRIRDYILLSSALVGEILDEARTAAGLVPEIMKARYGFVPPNYKKGSYLSTVSRMLTTGDIEKKVGKDGRVSLLLTSTGKEKFKRRFPIISLRKEKWDGYFMVVVFDIPEEERANRDTLREKLLELGFGMLQESVWISPLHFEEDLREFLLNRGLGEKVFVLETKSLLAGEIKKIVWRIWKLEELNNHYREVIERAYPF